MVNIRARFRKNGAEDGKQYIPLYTMMYMYRYLLTWLNGRYVCGVSVVTASIKDLYKMGPTLGVGGFGTVLSGRCKRTGQKVLCSFD